MRENTPPRLPEIDDDDAEEIYFDDDLGPPPNDEDYDEEELEELSMEALEELGMDEYGGPLARSPIPDNSIFTFEKHTAPVFSCALHPILGIVATGSEDDNVYVWDMKTAEVILQITGHKDTITDTHFNHDGTLLATGDMAGDIIIHKLQNIQSSSPIVMRRIWEYTMGDMSWMRWHRSANILIAGSDGGLIFVWRLPSGDCKVLPSPGIRCEAGDLGGDGKKLFAAYSNGNLKLWDIKSCTVLMSVDNQNPIAHKNSVTSVASCLHSALYISGGEDGKIVFCTNSGIISTVAADGPVECVSFSPSADLKLVASGTLHGQIAIWDYVNFSLRTLCERTSIEDGVTKLRWINENTLLASTIQGYLHGFDARTGKRKFTLTGHNADIYDFDYDPNENIVLTASEDKTSKIFKLPDYAV